METMTVENERKAFIYREVINKFNKLKSEKLKDKFKKTNNIIDNSIIILAY
jgi:hypothetical protein